MSAISMVRIRSIPYRRIDPLRRSILRSAWAVSLAAALATAFAGGATYVGAWSDGVPVFVQLELVGDGAAYVRIRSAPRPHAEAPGPWLDAPAEVAWSDEGVVVVGRAPDSGSGESMPLAARPVATERALHVRLAASRLPDRPELDPFGTAVLGLRDASGRAPREARLDAIGTMFESRVELADGSLGVVRSAPFFYAAPWRALDLTQKMLHDVGLASAEGLAQRRSSPRSVAGFWADERTAYVTALDGRIASVLFLSYAFRGGAHPNTWVESGAYVRSGDAWEAAGLCRVLSVLDVPCREDALRARAIDDLRAAGAAWVLAGDVTVDTPWLLDTFAVTSGGLRFDFPPYAVGPYAQGPFVAFVPFEAMLAR